MHQWYRQVFHTEKFKIIYVDIVPSKWWGTIPHCLKATIHCDFLLKRQVIIMTNKGQSHDDSMYPGNNKKDFASGVFLPKTYKSNPVLRTKIRQNPK